MIAAGGEERRLGTHPLRNLESQHPVIETERPLQVGNLQVNVADADPGINGFGHFLAPFLFLQPSVRIDVWLPPRRTTAHSLRGCAASASPFPVQSKRYLTANRRSSRRSGCLRCLPTTTMAMG